MPIASKRLHIGKSYRIEFVSDTATIAPSLLIRGWVPKGGQPAPPESLPLFAAPGSGDHDQGTVPNCFALDLDWDVPDDARSKVTVRVVQDGQEIVNETETADGGLTVLVEQVP